MNLQDIYLEGNPCIQFRDILEAKSKKEITDIIKRPFITSVSCILHFKLENKVYEIEIVKGFIFDGATILLLFTPLVGESSDSRFILGALIHDYFLDKRSEFYPLYFKHILTIHEYILFTTKLFINLLQQTYVHKLKSFLMGAFIYLWQISIFNRKLWSKLNS